MTSDAFATTRWTIVLAAGQRSTPQSDVALEQLCRTYWYPLYAYVRRRGHTREDAEDLTQGFFAHFLGGQPLAGLSSEKGKFRAFLLASLKHFLANARDHAARQKRGGAAMHLSLDWEDADAKYQCEVMDDASPDRLYDRAWAVTLLERVVDRLRAAYEREDALARFEAFKPFLTVSEAAVSHATVAADLDISEAAARVAVHRLRRRYREMLREELADTLATPAQIQEELGSLFASFAS